MILSRRTFLLMASTAIFTSSAQAAETADIIYSGGPILTMDDANRAPKRWPSRTAASLRSERSTRS